MRKLPFLLSLAFLAACSLNRNVPTDIKEIESVFIKVPDSIQTSVYWYWISDHLSKEGVVKDLHAMKKVGINRAFIGNIGLEEIPKEQWGKVKIFSDEWWDILHVALKTATELNIDIGIFNSPGWSQSGGPWVKENQAMRYLTDVDTIVQGGKKFQGKLPQPVANFQPVKVLAFPLPQDYHVTLANANAQINSTIEGQTLKNVLDGDQNTFVDLPAGKSSEISFQLPNDFTARGLTIYPAKRGMGFTVKLEVETKGKYQTVKTFKLDRTNTALNVGFDPHAPVSATFQPVKGKKYRLIFDEVRGHAGIAEIALSTVPRVERYKEKSLAKMHPTPLPYWKDYLWDEQVALDDPAIAVNPGQVQDLSSQVNDQGELNWDIPAGDWMIIQSGMLPTGVKNMPSSIEGRGLEVDKMSATHASAHFDAYMGEIIRRIPAADRKSFKVVVQDSYETGGQNWTDDFIEKFQKAFKYDPTPYLPVFQGFVVGSQDESDRFLWDIRRFVADQVAYEYVGGLRKISHKHGLTTWLENYGHWGFPGEFLQYGGQSDEIGGEFWNEGDLGNIENRAASSSAHIYGKKKVSAESFTAAGNEFGRYPALLKQRTDRFFAEGINNSLLHVYIHQPYEDKRPGVNTWFGTEFNRFNTWFYDMDSFIDYLKRCNYLLQQGNYVADVAYFIGEDAPKMTGIQDPALPIGYAFDYINAEVILNRLQVKNGRFVLPDGLSYKILVLPQLETMRPELIMKLEELVQAGGVVLGPKPKRSPSLTNFKQADAEVQKIANKLWANLDGQQNKQHAVGKGMVLQGMDLQAALDLVQVKPDVDFGGKDGIQYIHRELGEVDIYFLTNQTADLQEFTAKFRVADLQPELWDAVNGKIRDLPVYTYENGQSVVPLQLEAKGSAFIIFRKPSKQIEKSKIPTSNFPKAIDKVLINGPWKVSFMNSDSSTFVRTFENLEDWAKSTDEAIKYFSGSASYSITLPSLAQQKGKKLILDLGNLSAVAVVKINQKEVGKLWVNPYKIDISDYLQEGNNQLEIKVTNTWVNRLIGDKNLPKEKQSTWSIANSFQPNSPLQASGLFGPVSIEVY